MSRVRVLGATLAACAVIVLVGAAAEANLGTWKLNQARSKLAPGPARNTTVVYELVGYRVKVTVDGTDAQGKPLHSEWVGMFDGHDYPVTGDPASDMRSYKRVDDRTLEFTGKKNGRVSVSGSVVVAPDGKSRTVTATAVDGTGETVTSTSVYDRVS